MTVDPKTLRFGDGPYVVVATHTAADGSGVTEERRRVIFDRTHRLAHGPAGHHAR